MGFAGTDVVGGSLGQPLPKCQRCLMETTADESKSFPRGVSVQGEMVSLFTERTRGTGGQVKPIGSANEYYTVNDRPAMTMSFGRAVWRSN